MTGNDELTQEQTDRLLSVFMSGFASGISTIMASRLGSAVRDAPLSAEATASILATAQVFAASIVEDPAVRHELGEDLAKLWTDGTTNSVKVMTAHLGTPGGHR